MIPQNKNIRIMVSAAAILAVVGAVVIIKKRSPQDQASPEQETVITDSEKSASALPSGEKSALQKKSGSAQTGSPVPVTGASLGSAAPGAPGVPTQGGASESSAASAPQAPAAPEHHCFTVSYTHKKLPSHSDEEACSQHKNLIKLKHSKVNVGSLCVRVNDIPVRHQWVKGKSDEIVIGAIAGPKSVVTARYCLGKHTCKEDCKIPRDEFMDAIGGSDEEALPTGKLAHWEATDAAERDSAAVAKLEVELKKELDGEEGTSLFQGWISGNETPACERMPASAQARI